MIKKQSRPILLSDCQNATAFNRIRSAIEVFLQKADNNPLNIRAEYEKLLNVINRNTTSKSHVQYLQSFTEQIAANAELRDVALTYLRKSLNHAFLIEHHPQAAAHKELQFFDLLEEEQASKPSHISNYKDQDFISRTSGLRPQALDRWRSPQRLQQTRSTMRDYESTSPSMPFRKTRVVQSTATLESFSEENKTLRMQLNQMREELAHLNQELTKERALGKSSSTATGEQMVSRSEAPLEKNSSQSKQEETQILEEQAVTAPVEEKACDEPPGQPDTFLDEEAGKQSGHAGSNLWKEQNNLSLGDNQDETQSNDKGQEELEEIVERSYGDEAQDAV